MNVWEASFLRLLASKKQGRCSYALVQRENAMGIAGNLLKGGYIKERRLGYDEGFQITDLGREYLGGAS